MTWGRLWRALYHKFYVDELYDALIIRPCKGLGNLLAAFDLSVIDGFVNGTAAALGLALPVHCEVSSIATAVALVEGGMGISVLPSYIRSVGGPRRLQLRPLVEPAVRRELCLLSLRDRAMPPAAQAFAQMLHGQVAQQDDAAAG